MELLEEGNPYINTRTTNNSNSPSNTAFGVKMMCDNDVKHGEWLASPPAGEEVVITGISGRFPNSHNTLHLQQNLFNKVDMIAPAGSRWKVNHPEVPRRIGSTYNIDKLDAGYFGIHGRQAHSLDPMVRKVLETAVEAVLDAGLNPKELKGSKTGVFIGVCYAEIETESLTKRTDYVATGCLKSMIANRISYFLQLKGPSVIADTACSSSLNALELAVNAIRTGRCENAIVGGTMLLRHPGLTRTFYTLGVLSIDGACKVFDESADGYARADAVSCIFLQRAQKAKRIYAQIVHVKINEDGFKKEGILYPSGNMQKALMETVMKEAKVQPSDLAFLEAHGTGTRVGDPEECNAIDLTIAQKRKEPLLIGSAKSSLGHSEATSGMSSIMKVLIAFETGFIAPNIQLTNLKQALTGIVEGRMKVITELTKLKEDDELIGVNNFGFGGNNAHLLLRRFKKVKTNSRLRQNTLVCLSGRTEKSVLKIVEEVCKKPDREHIALLHQIFKQEVEGHCFRGYTIVSESGALETHCRPYSGVKPQVVVYFGQFERTAEVLLNFLFQFPCFGAVVSRVNELLVRTILLNGIQEKSLTAFSVQIGIAKILKELQVKATCVYGDPLGDLVCSYYQDEITLEDAVKGAQKLIEKSEATCPKIGKTSHVKYQSFQLTELETRNFENVIADNNNCITLNISDANFNNKNTISFTNGEIITFLEALGRLYEEGCDLHIYNIYPPVEFPVSRGTASISPSIRWNWQKTWYTYYFKEPDNSKLFSFEYDFYTWHTDHKFLLGHVVDGRNLFPATGYLTIVWDTLLQNYDNPMKETLPVVFENVKFIKAVTLSPKDKTTLDVCVHKGSGRFVVVQKESVVVTGKVFVPEDIQQHFTELPQIELKEGSTEVLQFDEIYRELYLRGYNYSDVFKGIVKCNIDASSGLVKWESNWVSFLDKMLQMKILEYDTRSLYVPVGIDKLAIYPNDLLPVSNNNQELRPVYNYKDCSIIKCKGVEISGLKASPISKKKSAINPVLEKYVFVPNKTQLSLQESARVNTQIILEESLEKNFKGVEILDSPNPNEPMLPLIAKALNDVPVVVLNLVISSDTAAESESVKVEPVQLTPESNLLLIVATKILQRPDFLTEALSALSPNGFLLSREDASFEAGNCEDLDVLTEHLTPNETIILMRKKKPQSGIRSIAISSQSFEWLSDLRNSKEHSCVVHSNKNSEGLLGFVNCLRQEPNGRNLRGVFLMDEAPEFNIEDAFYAEQLKKNFAVNVYRNKSWGTFRHMLLEELQEVECGHVFAQNLVKGDLSSLIWMTGELKPTSKPDDGFFLVYPYYCALNFKDIMVASGRVNVDVFNKNRIHQDCALGMEFAGTDVKGRRVCGFVKTKAIASMIFAEEVLSWNIPDQWSFEEASTLPIVYSTVIYGLFWVTQLKAGSSILIHSATGGIGLAALNICLHYKCNIYVTVGTKEKKAYLRENYPQIPESHIGNSRDLSFEDMIKTQTKGRGVDFVINSLSEEKLEATVRCVAIGGCFLEIGKYDLQNNAAFSLLLLQRKISYHGVMLDQMTEKAPRLKEWVHSKFEEGVRLGYIKPLPTKVYEKHELIDAFKHMTTGKHIGKILIKIKDENLTPTYKAHPRFNCDAQKSYIIVGGLGGFGLELTDWLFLRGAKKIVLVSRNGVTNGYQKQRIRIWNGYGVDIRISTEDVTQPEDCLRLINFANQLGPVDAIFNLAVVLKDALFEDQTEESFKSSLAPKAQITRNLDQVSRKLCPELKHFVVFSSVSCGRGNAGQSNYGMGNSVMERICEQRKSEGLPGLAIQWGAIGDVGLVAKMQRENKELVIGGTLQQKIASCLEVLDVFLNQKNAVVSSMVVAEKIERHLKLTSPAEAIAYILGLKDVKSVNPNISLGELGMDSLTATEMMQMLEKDFGIFVSTKEIRYLTFGKLIEMGNEQNQLEADKKEAKKPFNALINYFPPDLGCEPLIQLPSAVQDNEEAPTVIVVPGVEGSFTDLHALTSKLRARFLGINYKTLQTFQEIVNSALPAVEAIVSKQGSFIVLAYSYGAVVAIELVSLLEARGFQGLVINIDGAPLYFKYTLQQNFSTVSNQDVMMAEYLMKLLSVCAPLGVVEKFQREISTISTFEDRIEAMISYVPKELVTGGDFQKQATIGLFGRIIATVQYEFEKEKLKAPVHLFRAKWSIVSNIAQDYCISDVYENVQVTVLDGDHHSILLLKRLVDSISQLLDV